MRESVGKGSKGKGKVEKAAALPAPVRVTVEQETPADPSSTTKRPRAATRSTPTDPPPSSPPALPAKTKDSPPTNAKKGKAASEKAKEKSEKEVRPPAPPEPIPAPPAAEQSPAKSKKADPRKSARESAAKTRPVPKAASARTTGKSGLSAPVPPQPPSVTVEPLHRHPSAIALKSFEQAVKVFNRRQYAEARTLFENMMARYPQELEILARVQVYLQVCLQRLASATSTPETASALYDQGVFALNKGDLKAARSLFERALRLNPRDPHLFYSMAVTLLQSGQIDECLAYLEQCIRLQPRFRSQALNDSDFTELRENRQFLALLGVTSPFDRLESRK